MLEADEIVTEIAVPALQRDTRSAFLKFSLQEIDRLPDRQLRRRRNPVGPDRSRDARICLNAVYVTPYRATAAEAFITGKSLTEENATAAADAVATLARPMSRNKYMVQIAATMVKRTLACLLLRRAMKIYVKLYATLATVRPSFRCGRERRKGWMSLRARQLRRLMEMLRPAGEPESSLPAEWCSLPGKRKRA